MSKDKIKFPFEPSEKVKAAFRQDFAMKRAVEIMTQALLAVAAQIENPWLVLIKEHPELTKEEQLTYNFGRQVVDLKPR